MQAHPPPLNPTAASPVGWWGEFTSEAGSERDLRLAGTAGGAWLAAWAALSLPLTWVLLGGAGAVGCCVALWRWRRGATLIAVALGVAAGTAAAAAHVAQRDDGALGELVRQRVTTAVELTITDDPRLMRTGRGYVVTADLTRAGASPGNTPGQTPQDAFAGNARVTVLASAPEWSGLLPGQRLRVQATFGPTRGGTLRAALLSTAHTPQLLGCPPWYQRAAGKLRTGLQHASTTITGPASGLLPGLVVGDTSRLDPGVAEDFRRVGMTHLVSVSGANCAIVVGCVLFLLRGTRAGPRTTALLGALALIGFVVLARPSPSVLRAAAMGLLALVGMAFGRPRAALPALCAGVFLLVLVDPELAGDAGFALSVAATAGLLLLAPSWKDAVVRRGLPPSLAEAIAIPTAAQVACAPLIAVLSASVSVIAVPANFLIGPAVAPATILGVVAAAVSPLWPEAAGWIAWLAGWAARWLVWVAQTGAAIPGGVLPWPGGLPGGLLLTLTTILIIYCGRIWWLRRVGVTILLGVAAGAIPVRMLAPGWPPPGWVFAACDVGQGDALVLPAAPAAAVVIDAGPDPRPVNACLKRLGVREVPMLVVSHHHADHVAGLAGVFAGRRVAHILAPEVPEPEAGYRLVADFAATFGATVTRPVPGREYHIGAVRLEILGPARRLSGTRSEANDNSVVLRATVGGVRMLLTGDAENTQQQELRHQNLRADIMKVAHHGSRYQEESFIDAISPAVAVISVGADNSYGHPSPTLIDHLTHRGIQVLRTDQGGDIAISGRPGALTSTHRGGDRAEAP